MTVVGRDGFLDSMIINEVLLVKQCTSHLYTYTNGYTNVSQFFWLSAKSSWSRETKILF